MSGSNLTAVIGAILSSIPAFLPFIPAPFNLIVAGVLNTINAVWHFNQPAPSQKSN